MAEERNKETVRRVYDAFNRRDLDALEDLLDPDFTDHMAAGRDTGAEGVKNTWEEMWRHYPNLRIYTEEMMAEGERVAARVTFRGADGAVLGHMAEFIRVREDKVTELWNLARLS